MKTVALAFRYLWAKPLAAVLNVLLLSLGLASASFVLLMAEQIDQAFERDLAGIDLVVGAKGSPMQLILSGVFHIDVPSGNVRLDVFPPNGDRLAENGRPFPRVFSSVVTFGSASCRT